MSDRECLMLAVQQAGFTVYDTALFLDTHPDNTEALAFFENAKEAYKKARADYESVCGPLTLSSAGGEEYWDWVKKAWPWEED